MDFLNSLSKKILHIKESIQNTYSNSLFTKFFAGWAFLSFLISFDTYFGQNLLKTNSPFPCFPNFQNCKNLINLLPLNHGDNEQVFFTLLFALIVLGIYFLYKKNFFYTHLTILSIFIVKLVIFLSNYQMGNYDYYDLVIIFVFLIYPHRLDLIKLAFVVLYFLASTIKIHEGWILGTYFSSLYNGLPLVPDTLIPFATNIVIISQILGCWFLLSKNKKVSDYALYFFLFFHLYSTVLVGFRYPITSVLSLMILFLIKDSNNKPENFSITKKTAPFYLFLTVLFLIQSVAFLIPGDQKLTLEGNSYGLYMFEANHQCVTNITDDKNNKRTIFSYSSRQRCDPYRYLYFIKNTYCSDNKKVSWTLDHSINGNSFRRIVDTSNACILTYKPFIHNDWIRNEKTSPSIGMPYKNMMISTSIELDNSAENKDGYIYPPSLSKSSPSAKNSVQILLEKYLNKIELFYWILWFLVLVYMIGVLLKNTFSKSR